MSAIAGSSRGTLQVRSIEIKPQVLDHLDGSASFAFGQQSAIAAVSGPVEVRIRDELTDRATLEINYVPLKGVAGITASSFSTALHLALSSIILLHLHPRSLIQLHLQTTNQPAQAYLPPTLQSALNRPLTHFTRKTIRPSRPHPDAALDVSEKAALINAGMMALIQSGVPCLATVCALGVAVLPRRLAMGLRRGDKNRSSHPILDTTEGAREEEAANDSPTILLDPDPTEESLALSVHLFAFACAGQAVDCNQDAGHGDEVMDYSGDADENAASDATASQAKLILIESSGGVDVNMHAECIRLARHATLGVQASMRRAVRDSLLG